MVKNPKSKKVLVSGIQPSGRLHIGNYFGAIRQIVDLVNNGTQEAYLFVADYHSMTSLTNSEERRQNILEVVAAYLACGLDKRKVSIFKQSDIPQVTELAWILSNVTPIPMLFLAHSFKDKVGQTREEKINFENLKNVNAGLFNYPVLMAADILIYGSDIIPVGKDQKQHIEYAREIAKKYNFTYNVGTFKYPEAYLKKEVEIVLGTDGNKMSKSKNNIIPIFGTQDEIKKIIMSIKTDSFLPNQKKDPDENNIYNIHKLFLSPKENMLIREKYLNSDKVPYSYKEAKEELSLAVIDYFSNMNKKFDFYMKNPKGKKELLNIMKNGAKKAEKRARKTMQKVRMDTGLELK